MTPRGVTDERRAERREREMTDLTDFQRLVHDPYVEKAKARIRELTVEAEQLRAERDAAREALRRIADPLNHHHKPDYTAPERIAREALENSAPGVGATPTTAAERYDGANGPTSGASAEGNDAAPGAEAAARAGGCAADALREIAKMAGPGESGTGAAGWILTLQAPRIARDALARFDRAVSGQTAEKEEARG